MLDSGSVGYIGQQPSSLELGADAITLGYLQKLIASKGQHTAHPTSGLVYLPPSSLLVELRILKRHPSTCLLQPPSSEHLRLADWDFTLKLFRSQGCVCFPNSPCR